jgi:AcrR family transcriptional regulator
MPITTRKQRELLQRETLILDTAQAMMHEYGYNFLTMDRIAEAVEYSKGTLYNHFASKEDIVGSLCCRSLNNLLGIFQRAYDYQGSTRERYAAIGIGYSLYNQLHPLDTHNIQTVKTNAVREKVSDEKMAELKSLEHEVTLITQRIVQEAIDCGDLDKKYQDHVKTIVFGCWSMHYGALLLNQSDIPLNELGFSPVVKMLWQNSNIYLDGYQWQPLSNTPDNIIDNEVLFEKISSAVFADELELLTQKNKLKIREKKQ